MIVIHTNATNVKTEKQVMSRGKWPHCLMTHLWKIKVVPAFL